MCMYLGLIVGDLVVEESYTETNTVANTVIPGRNQSIM